MWPTTSAQVRTRTLAYASLATGPAMQRFTSVDLTPNIKVTAGEVKEVAGEQVHGGRG